MRRAGSLIRRINWLSQVRHHAREQAWTPNYTIPTCHRCGVHVFDEQLDRFVVDGPPLQKVEVYNINTKHVELVGFCAAPGHSGSREDAIRVDFDWVPDKEDIDRAVTSCVFFPRGSEEGAA